jgi:hypothetical protein
MSASRLSTTSKSQPPAVTYAIGAASKRRTCTTCPQSVRRSQDLGQLLVGNLLVSGNWGTAHFFQPPLTGLSLDLQQLIP